ncbi:MAG: S41 family peptidase [Chloroflexi bacterium]|nr:S41 family peptidase [Chloroflexota bacterium]
MDDDRPQNDAPGWGAANPNLAAGRPQGPAWAPQPGAQQATPQGAAYATPATPPAPSGAPPSGGWVAAPPPPRRGGIGGYIAVALATAAISAVLAFSGGVVVGAGIGASVAGEIASNGPVPAASTKPGDPNSFGLFTEAWEILRKNYVDQAALEAKDITYGAIRGMTDAIGDTEHTRFLTPDELARQEQDLSGSFAGIGAVLSEVGAELIVQSVIPGTPAERAGVKAGDRILAVDGADTTGKSVDDVVREVRGDEGTQVTLTLVHKGESDPFDVTITRAVIAVPAVSWAMYPGTDTAVVRLEQFQADSGDDMMKALKAAKEAGAERFVLDLRANPGGYVGEAVEVASQFLDGGTVYIQRNAQDDREAVPALPNGEARSQPLVVLVDAGSASSSEIVSGALQDAGRATLVGERTFGTGTVLTPYRLSDGSALYVGTVEWLTPKGNEIWRRGIDPDVVVAIPDDGRIVVPSEFAELGADGIVKANDAQLQRALEILAQE